MSSVTSRSGLLAGGNFLIDQVKVIDIWPDQDALSNILSQSRGNGGGPYNVLKDLALMQAGFPLAAVGLVGDDDAGAFIANDLAAHGIDGSRLQTTRAASTSFTDVMTARQSGRRTFFHYRGANALLDLQHFDFSTSNYRLFYLAYLMLLDTLDAMEEDGSNRFARVLKEAKDSGHLTIADAVSAESDDYETAVKACLPYLDFLVLNEWEASRATRRDLFADTRPQWDQFRLAARQLHDHGETQAVVIHYRDGAYALSRDGEESFRGSVNIPSGRIAGSVGAGDAFCAGLISGIHDQLSMHVCLERATCVAASSLLDATSSGGVGNLASCLALGSEYGYRAGPDSNP